MQFLLDTPESVLQFQSPQHPDLQSAQAWSGFNC